MPVNAYDIKRKLLRAYDQHVDAIFRHCFYRVYSRETAEDLTQETFMRFFEYLTNGNNVQHVKSFLYRTANNLIIDHVRKKKESSLDEMMAHGFDPPAHIVSVADAIDQATLLNLVARLEKEYRIPLLMRYVDGLKPREIALILNESQNSISVRIYRGLKKMKHLLKKTEKRPSATDPTCSA